MDDFDWIPSCVTMLIYRTCISGSLHMWIIVSTMILVTYDLVYISPIVITMLCHVHFILMVVILTDNFPSIHFSRLCHCNNLHFSLILFIVHLLVVIILGALHWYISSSMHFHPYFCSNRSLVGIICWIPVLLILLGLCVLVGSTFTSKLYFMVFIDIFEIIFEEIIWASICHPFLDYKIWVKLSMTPDCILLDTLNCDCDCEWCLLNKLVIM